MTSNIIEALVSINRLAAFFAADELQADARELAPAPARLAPGDEVLCVAGGAFAWSRGAASPTLEDVDLRVRKGELVGVLGRVGAGKVRGPLERGARG